MVLDCSRAMAELLCRLLVLAQKCLVGEPDALLQPRAGTPAELCEPAHIQQLSGRAVWPRRIEADFAAVADGRGHKAGKLGNRNVLAGADIDEFSLRIGLHQMDASVGEIVDIEEF